MVENPEKLTTLPKVESQDPGPLLPKTLTLKII